MEATFYVEGPSVKRTLKVLNELENELPFDLDVFVLLQPSTTGLISLAPIYDALRVRGDREEQECVVIEGVPVQFLSAYNALIEEALTQARENRIRRCAHPSGAGRTCHGDLFAHRPRQRSESDYSVSKANLILDTLPICCAAISWKRNGKLGRNDSGVSASIHGEGRTPQSASPSSISGEGRSGNQITADGSAYPTRAREGGAALDY